MVVSHDTTLLNVDCPGCKRIFKVQVSLTKLRQQVECTYCCCLIQLPEREIVSQGDAVRLEKVERVPGVEDPKLVQELRDLSARLGKEGKS